MNIVNKLTLRHLKENKRRTLVTIIGVIISVAMLTAVTTLAVSFMSLLQKQQIADEGEWHVLYKNVNEEQLKIIQDDKNSEKVILSHDAGYADLEGIENESKPYLFVKEYNEEGFKQFPIELIEGKIPTKENELLISEHIITNGKVELKIGDQLSLDIGERIFEDKELSGYAMDQSLSFQTMGNDIAETIENITEKNFTIVGIMKRPTWEPMSAPGYTVLSYLPNDVFTVGDTVNASVVWKKINRSAVKDSDQLSKSLDIVEPSYNKSLLRFYGVISDEYLLETLYGLATIIMTIIIICSVSLNYNAFAISVSERSRHLGMLSSVGATRKQKRNSVFFEGFVIGAISIPLGIISGLTGIGITFYFINSLIQDSLGVTEKLTVVVTPLSIIVACAVSILTIFISTYIPAKRASKVSAIDAIRQTMDVKMTGKKLKTSKVVRKIFGIEAEFGLKNLKRNKRRYSAIVFSLVVSIVLFLTVSFFTDEVKRSTQYFQQDLNYDIEIASFNVNSTDHAFDDSLISSITLLDKVTDASFIKEIYLQTELDANQTPEELREIANHEKYHLGISLHVLQEEELRNYAEEIGVNYSDLTKEDKTTGVIVNRAILTNEKRGESVAVNMNAGESLALTYDDYYGEKEIELGNIEVVALTDKRPLGVEKAYQGSITMIVSEETFAQLNKDDEITEGRYALYLSSSDPLAIHEEIEKLKDSSMHIFNHHKIKQDDDRFILLISVFTYGFIALITAISVANIFNTISTSISLRKREFGMLKSVGMTPKGFNKMINYESIFYGVKSLLFGLPISIGVMYLIYHTMMDSFDYPFVLPWVSILIVIFGVFIIVGAAMLYSSSKVKKENIIDALKQENI